jgi:hypothetical protein
LDPGDRARVASLVLVAILVTACSGQVQIMPAQDPPSDPCKIAVTHLGAFTQRFAGDLVSLRTLLVATTFDSGETTKAIRVVSASLAAFPELEPSLQRCPATADLAPRIATLRGAAETSIAPSLAAVLSDGDIHWVAAYSLVRLLSETIALSEAAQIAGDPLKIAVATATDPAGATAPPIPPARYADLVARIGRRGREFVALLTEDDLSLFSGVASEQRRVGRRIADFSSTEIKWLKSHPALPCYAPYWKVLVGVWTDLSAAGTAFVNGSTSSARSSLAGASAKLNSLLDLDEMTTANQACILGPQAP